MLNQNDKICVTPCYI